MADAIDQTKERRKTTRRRVRLPAKIEFDRERGIDCEVRNISDAGALIVVDSSFDIPDAFTLLISDGTSFQARVKWRRARSIGVLFG